MRRFFFQLIPSRRKICEVARSLNCQTDDEGREMELIGGRN